MIHITIGLNADATLNHYRAAGHAKNGKPGEDVVCAAATCLLRTAAGILALYRGLKLVYKAEKPGQMELSILQLPEEQSERIKGVTDFLLKGLTDLQSEYPENISLTIMQ